MSDDPMHSRRTRLAVAARIVRDRRTLHVPPGHPYSPIPSGEDVARALRRSDAAAATLPGIDLREADQLDLVRRLLPLYRDLPFQGAPGHHRYHYENDWFTYSDAIGYALLLRHLRPRRVIEVGAGYSSALALDIDELFLAGRTQLLFIDPDPDRLRSLVPASELEGRLLACRVQDVPLARFEELEAGDVLFVDSSHVLKAGSDVQHLVDEVYPRLAPGVHVHVHDVFYPFEYPAGWLATGCAVNEAYAMRALLQSTTAYEIVLFNTFLERFHRDWFAEHMPLVLAGRYPTGGIWLRRR
ncbi:MAG: class I SAM-dependent methyltransferase [Chloroflexota bacterium]